MEAAQTTAQTRSAPGIAGLVVALAGPRRSGSNPRRALNRRGRRKGVAADASRESGAGVGSAADPQERSAGPVGAPDDDGRRRSGDQPRERRTGRPGAAACRRRDVEAGLIGLTPEACPTWWESSWARGLDQGVAPDRLFDQLADLHTGVRVLHGLEVPGAATTIDHVLIGGGGVVVAGSQTSSGRVRSDGVHLRVRGRDRSPVIDVALWQAEVVRSTLEHRGLQGVPVHGVLHWQHLEGLGDRPICLRGIPLLSAGATMGLAAAGMTVSPHLVERIAAVLAPARGH